MSSLRRIFGGSDEPRDDGAPRDVPSAGKAELLELLRARWARLSRELEEARP